MTVPVGLRDDRSDWIEPRLLERLNGRLWHATDTSGLEGILRDEMIRADAATRHHAAYVRSIGAVSVFDLGEPDSGIHRIAAHWSDWLRERLDTSYWLEIDRSAVAPQFLDVRETLRRWQERLDAGGMTATRLIANIEAAHVGPIPLSNVVAILAVNKGRAVKLPREFAEWRAIE